MPRKPQPEGLDKAAKLKIGGSIGALVIAILFLVSYYTGFSIFGGGQPKAPDLTPQQVQEVEKVKQELKKKVDNPPPGPGGAKPVIVGS